MFYAPNPEPEWWKILLAIVMIIGALMIALSFARHARGEEPMIYSQPIPEIPLEEFRDDLKLMEVDCTIDLPKDRPSHLQSYEEGHIYIPPIEGLTHPFQPLYDTGLWYVDYDRNGDGYTDYRVLYQTHKGKRMPFPLFYMEDINGDDWMDYTYIDQYGWGRCEDMLIYSNKAVPKDRERRYPEMKGGRL